MCEKADTDGSDHYDPCETACPSIGSVPRHFIIWWHTTAMSPSTQTSWYVADMINVWANLYLSTWIK